MSFVMMMPPASPVVRAFTGVRLRRSLPVAGAGAVILLPTIGLGQMPATASPAAPVNARTTGLAGGNHDE